MTASTIAEVFVDADGIRVEMEIGAEDIGAFRNLLPDKIYEKLSGKPRPLAERVEAFLTARELTAPVREEIESSLAVLSEDGGALRKIRAGTALLRQLADFHTTRNEALLETELMTEYLVAELPMEFRLADIARVALMAVGLALVATIYPAWRAARVDPAEVLKYE